MILEVDIKINRDWLYDKFTKMISVLKLLLRECQTLHFCVDFQENMVPPSPSHLHLGTALLMKTVAAQCQIWTQLPLSLYPL